MNGYRVREVQRRIQVGDGRALKMVALALDAGFASKSTFNQAFKKHTNQTPSDFRPALDAYVCTIFFRDPPCAPSAFSPSL